MSLPNSTSTLESPIPTPAGSYRKPKADIYTMFLAFALIAVLLGILFLCLLMSNNGWDIKPVPPPPPPQASVSMILGHCLT